MVVVLGDPLRPRLSEVVDYLLPIHEQDLARVVVRIDLEGDDAERFEGPWQDDRHVIGCHHGGAGHI